METIKNTEEIYRHLVDEAPSAIYGKDFIAQNYGSEYSKTFNGGKRKIGISGDSVSYFSSTAEGGFPENVIFNTGRGNAPLRETTHVGNNNQSFTTNLTLEKVVKTLRENGMKFEKSSN
jgi:hypothetical protein